jgi:hypothetical protein
MPKTPARTNTAKPTPQSSITQIYSEVDPGALTPMSFRVPAQFRREFKLYAVQHGMSMGGPVPEIVSTLKDPQQSLGCNEIQYFPIA